MKDIAVAGVIDESIAANIGTDHKKFAAALEDGYHSRYLHCDRSLAGQVANYSFEKRCRCRLPIRSCDFIKLLLLPETTR
jgi:hypothetical protein